VKGNAKAFVDAAVKKQINIRMLDANTVRPAGTPPSLVPRMSSESGWFVVVMQISVSFDETTAAAHIDELLAVFASVVGAKAPAKAAALAEKTNTDFPKQYVAPHGMPVPCAPLTDAHACCVVCHSLLRKTPYLTHAVFNSYHSETDMLRYLYKLQTRDLSLGALCHPALWRSVGVVVTSADVCCVNELCAATAMIPLGSCTMKLNATSEMIPITLPEVNGLHPFVPVDQAKGYHQMIEELGRDLCEVTGFHAISMQPNAGSQGEYAGLRVINAYHASRGEAHRNVCLIPTSAHGTNPASAVMAGLKVVTVACDAHGNIDVADLKAKATTHSKKYAAALSLRLSFPLPSPSLPALVAAVLTGVRWFVA
jgi:hypothetical protein